MRGGLPHERSSVAFRDEPVPQGVSARRRRTRYLLDVAENAETDSSQTSSRFADSREGAVRNLVALPLRMLAGTLGVVEAVVAAAADALRDVEPREERIDELEKRVTSLEHLTAGRGDGAGSPSP